MKWFICSIFLVNYLFAFDIEMVDETKDGKIKKEQLANEFGKSRFELAENGKKIFKPIVNIEKLSSIQVVTVSKPIIISPKINIVKSDIEKMKSDSI